MKVINKLWGIAMMMVIFLLGCKSDDPSVSITSLSVDASSETIFVGESVTLTATNQDGADVSSQVQFTADDVQLGGNQYTGTAAGTVELKAHFNDISSDAMTLEVVLGITSLTISSDKPTVKPTGTDVATLSAANQDNQDVTSLVDFYVNGELIEGNQATSNSFDDVVVQARYEGIQSDELTLQSELNTTSLTLSTDKYDLQADNGSKAFLIAKDQDGEDVSAFVDFTVDGAAHSEAYFTSNSAGTFAVRATSSGVESNEIEINVAANTVKKILIEEFTGEWCGWCPQAAYNIEQQVLSNSKIFAVGIHNGDALQFDQEDDLRGFYGINYFPSGLVGRIDLGDNHGYNGATFDPVIQAEIDRQLDDDDIKAGLSLSTSHDGSTATIDVDVTFFQDIGGPTVRLTIYIMEDNVVSGTQQNYFTGRAGYEGTYYYDQPAEIPNYVHKYVLRDAATDINGESIPQDKTYKDLIYTSETKEMDISGYNTDNCYVIAFVHYVNGGEMINAQQVKLGGSIGINGINE